jgi:hypothetical protein
MAFCGRYFLDIQECSCLSFAYEKQYLNEYEAKEIIKLADTASEVKEIKQHYAAGIKSRAARER